MQTFRKSNDKRKEGKRRKADGISFKNRLKGHIN